MNIAVEIAGRKALPVWTIPYATGRYVSPDRLLEMLAKPDCDEGRYSGFPNAFKLDETGNPRILPPSQWSEAVGQIGKLENDLDKKNLNELDDRQHWCNQSIELIMPYRAYLWLDEFEAFFEDYSRRFYAENPEICLHPFMPPEHAEYLYKTEVESSIENKLLRERQKAVAEIKASRTPKSDWNNQQLLDMPVSELIQESGLLEAVEFDLWWHLFSWIKQLSNEREQLKPSQYNDKKSYDDRIKSLNSKIAEIKHYINQSPVTDKTAKHIIEFVENIHNGRAIDWAYWAGLSNITPEQAAKLVHYIDPILWVGDTFAANKPYDGRYKGEPILAETLVKIRKLTQQLSSHSLTWTLVGLVSYIGKENVPPGMAEAAGNTIKVGIELTNTNAAIAKQSDDNTSEIKTETLNNQSKILTIEEKKRNPVFAKFTDLSSKEIQFLMMNDGSAKIIIRGKKITVTPTHLGLKAGSQGWKLLEGAAVSSGDLSPYLKKLNISNDLESENAKIKTIISRLRNTLKGAMGLGNDPIPYIKGTGYKFNFKTMAHELLKDNNISRGADAMDYVVDEDFEDGIQSKNGFWSEDE